MTDRHWRLIVDPPAAGAWNMAVDEAILESCVRSGGPPTLRLYAWQPAALSLGANQPAAYSAEFLREQGIHLVRRPTGGLAVLHENEQTYSITGSLRTEAFPGAVLDTYLRIAQALLGALALLGVHAEISSRRAVVEPPGPGTAACFGWTSSHEIHVGGRKLIGSAQVRRRGAFLQHGSIPLGQDPERLARALAGPVGQPATGLTTLTGEAVVSSGALTQALTKAFGRRFGVGLRRGCLSESEHELATELYSWKYLDAEWTLSGRRRPRRRRGPDPDPAVQG